MLKKFGLSAIGCTLLLTAQSQSDKRLQQADQYFAAGEYLTAAGLYNQFLHPVVKQNAPAGFPLNAKKSAGGQMSKGLTKTDILYKQAESYRLANYYAEAADIYMKCFEADGEKYQAALYWYAVCQRSLGHYNEAMNSINSFLSNNTAANPFYKDAQKEMETLLFVQRQINRPDTVMYHTQKLASADTGVKAMYALTPVGNKFIFTGNDTNAAAPEVVMKPKLDVKSIIAQLKSKEEISTQANPNHNRLFFASVTENGVQQMEAINIDNLDTLQNQAAASISADGQKLFFTQWKKTNGKLHAAIYVSTKKENGWSSPVALDAVNLQGYNTKQPFLTADGKYLFFASDRAGGLGKYDIWYAPVQANGSFGTPVNAGTVINTTGDEAAPFYHNESHTLVFATDGRPGMGGLDLFAAKGAVNDWKAAENMGYPVNSSRDDIYFFAAENAPLMNNALVSSDRGTTCCLETYSVKKEPKKKMVAGYVVDCKTNQPIADAALVVQNGSQNQLQLQSDEQGRFSYELTGDASQQQFIVSKEKYTDKTAAMQVESINEIQWQADTLHAAPVCLEEKLVIKVENVVSIYFDFDDSRIKEENKGKLDSIYTELMADTTIFIQISGYTDGLGSKAYNKILSDKRAKACADYLIEKGVAAGRITFESFGDCCPVEMELINGRDNPDGRSRNRRAMINIDRH